jgi:hypothetical protein
VASVLVPYGIANASKDTIGADAAAIEAAQAAASQS